MFLKLAWSFVSIILIFQSYSLASFDMAPIIATVTPTGPGATTSFTITNSSDTKTPIQVVIYRREPDVDGKEKYESTQDSGEMFQIFPSQLILNPKEKRTLRVTYVGEPKLKEELAFRIIAEEFPINVTDPKQVTTKAVASIAMLTKYIGSLYVKPVGTQPDIKVEGSLNKVAGLPQMVLVIQNKGGEHFILKQAKFTVVNSVDGKAYQLPKESLAAIGTQNILAGRSRKFSFPWPKEIPQGNVKVSLDLAKK